VLSCSLPAIAQPVGERPDPPSSIIRRIVRVIKFVIGSNSDGLSIPHP
jgi:hypothetical protein